MDNLRLILILCGGAFILGIYLWETYRRRSPPSSLDALMAQERDPLEEVRETDPAVDEAGLDEALVEPEADTALLDETVPAMDVSDLGRVVPDRDSGPVDALDGLAVRDDSEPALGTFSEMGRRDEELILVIGVIAARGNEFSCADLQAAFASVDLHYGDMGIFHHHGPGKTSVGRALFSAASMVEPGTLDLEQDPGFSTPGLMLFARLQGDPQDKEAFEAMLSAARRLAELLEGELQDEKRSSLTAQAVTHMRERITEFRRRQLLKSE